MNFLFLMLAVQVASAEPVPAGWKTISISADAQIEAERQVVRRAPKVHESPQASLETEVNADVDVDATFVAPSSLALGSWESSAQMTWLHIPKCGSSFGISLLAVSCPSIPHRDLQDLSGIVDNGGRMLCKCKACSCSACPVNVVGFHVPFDPRNGKHAGMFREPRKRIISQYMYKGGFGSGWGSTLAVKDEMKLSEKNLSSKDKFLAYAKHPSMRSCQTKMLLGHMCVDNVTITAEMTQQAITRLREEFAFVGDTDMWEESLHLLFPHGVPDFALGNTRPGQAKFTQNAKELRFFQQEAEQYLEALREIDWHDTPDEELYAEVKKLMHQRLADIPPSMRLKQGMPARNGAWWTVDSDEMDSEKLLGEATACSEPDTTCIA
jgi:hypothetical protein